MAIAVRQSTYTDFGAPEQYLSHAFSSNTLSGSLILYVLAIKDATASANWVGSPAGGGEFFTLAAAVRQGGVRVEIWYLLTGTVQGAFADYITVELSASANASIQLYEITGVALAAPFDTATAADSTSDTTANGDVFTVGATGIAVGIVMPDSNSDRRASAVSSGWTEDTDYFSASRPSFTTAYRIYSGSPPADDVLTVTMAGAATSASAVAYWKESSGTNYTKSVSGGLTPSGGIAKRTSRALAGAFTPAGAVVKRTARALAGGLTPTGTLIKRTARSLGGGITPSGAPTKQTARALGGGITPSATLAAIRTFIRAVGGALTPSGSISSRTISRALGGALTPNGVVNKITARALAGALTPSGGLNAIRTFIRAVGGSLTPSGAITNRAITRNLAGALTPSGALAKRTARALAGGLTPSGAIAKRSLRAVGGSLTPNGVVSRATSRILSATLVPAGNVAKRTARSLGGALTPAGTVIRPVLKALGGVLGLAGALVAVLITGDPNQIKPTLRNFFKAPGENQTYTSPRENQIFTSRKSDEERD